MGSTVFMSDDIILEFQNVTKQFPGVTALSEVSFKIKRGEIHGICGENGAGKSTLMKILSGVYPYGTYEGTVIYNGQELKLEASAIHQASEKGIAIVYQELTLVPQMTVGENIFLGREPVQARSISWNQLYADTRAILDKYQLDVHPQDVVKDLGVGKMQMTEIAKALSEDAQVLILDEPTSALAEAEIDKLMEILRTLKEHGVTCIYITHKMNEFFRICDNVTVLRDGKWVTTQPASQVTPEKLVSYMVGREMKERFPQGKRRPGEVIFEVKDLHAEQADREVLKGVSFDLRKGEILGIAGLMGSGRTELVMTIFGEFAKITHGSLLLEGREVKVNNSHHAMEQGISLVPEDRKRHGLGADPIDLEKHLAAQSRSLFQIHADQSERGSRREPAHRQGTDHQGAESVRGGRNPVRRQSAEGGDFQMAAVRPQDSDYGRPHARH